MLLVVDSEQKLLGIINDGDIRRVLLQSEALKTPLFKIMNSHPKTFKTGVSMNHWGRFFFDTIKGELFSCFTFGNMIEYWQERGGAVARNPTNKSLE